MKTTQLISLSKSEHRELINKLEDLASKENRSLSDTIMHLLGIGYSEYINRSIEDSIPYSVVSLFAGAGGLDTGLKMAGFNVIWANEIDKDACETYVANHPETYVERGDVRNVKSFPKADLVVGGYPCQGFSLAGNRLMTDERNYLYREFVRCLRQANPKFFIAENVKGLLTMAGGQIIEAMIQDFRNEGYIVNHHLVNAKDYGVPQDRERVLIIGVREDVDFKYEFPNPTHGDGLFGLKPYVTLKDAIGHLKPSEVGEIYDSTFSSRYLSRNRKRAWDEVSFTIQASGRHAPLHPSGEPMIKLGTDEWILPKTSEHRRLSAVECALIQTFPADYIWKGSLGSIHKQIGNAVPCLLAKAVAKPMYDFLKQYYAQEQQKQLESHIQFA
ncbi:DNA cytosine methyltransferase [Brevibacillus sp. M2.1A]|uniref:DNA cytosine methyltransferase n=1 Tax=Brevibacillus sp. M2.1A TaxID=2738980 RepID=UPI001C2CB81B|nr:DNA cytosine methyltransferase [Brevibacillus sp. M2.1A]MCC8433456.1 DNA cytosine methyltransferase [Brevibacillus sp. M2.1A]